MSQLPLGAICHMPKTIRGVRPMSYNKPRSGLSQAGGGCGRGCGCASISMECAYFHRAYWHRGSRRAEGCFFGFFWLFFGPPSNKRINQAGAPSRAAVLEHQGGGGSIGDCDSPGHGRWFHLGLRFAWPWIPATRGDEVLELAELRKQKQKRLAGS
jgi:hypothetical protein